MIASISKILIYFIFLLVSGLFAQWPLWSNPSLPVGGENSGEGLWKNQVAFSVSSNYQILHWSHDKLDINSEPEVNIIEDHHGDLQTSVIHLNSTIGLSDNFNLNITTSIGERWMDYKGKNETIHHRSESTKDSMGLYMGTTIIARYLILNEKIGPGKRIFLGLGLVIPSKNSLKYDPYLLTESLEKHTHFAISDGNFKSVLELQYFNRKKGLFFYGSTFRYDKVLKTNEYGYKSGDSFNYVGFIFFHHQKTLKYFLPYVNLSASHKFKDYWEESGLAENSDGGFANLGIGFNKKFDTFKINFTLNTTVYSWITPANDYAKQVDSALKSYYFSFSLGKTLNY